MKSTTVACNESEPYGSVNLDHNPVIVFSCGHIFSRLFCDQLFDINSNYSRNELGEFQSVVASGNLDVHVVTCPTCGKPLSGIQRYNRMLKRWNLNTILKNVSLQSHAKYGAVLGDFELFEIKMETSRTATLDQIRQVKNEKHRRPIITQNLDIVTSRTASFNHMREQVQRFREDIDECNHPLIKTYQMPSPAAAGTQQELQKLDFKFRLLADLLTLRMEALYLEDHQEFLARLTSVGRLEAKRLGYINLIDSCHKYAKDAQVHQLSCEARAYYRLAIGFLLLQLYFVTLEIRASKAISINPKTERPLEQGDRILSTCHSLLRRYSVCESYQVVVDGAQARFKNGSFRLTAVRKTISQAMGTKFSETGQWYQCLNGHIVRTSNVEFRWLTAVHGWGQCKGDSMSGMWDSGRNPLLIACKHVSLFYGRKTGILSTTSN
jgi:hypothetical protein